MVGVTCRCTLAFHWSTVGSRLLKGRDREKTPSGTSGRPLTPTHCALSGVNTPPTTPLGSVIAFELLSSEYWQILRDRVAEDRAKHADVIASTIAQTNYRLRIRLIGNA